MEKARRFIKGLKVNESNNCVVCIIEEFSEELENALRECLVRICHGKSRAEDEADFYTYKRTLGEFLSRLSKKEEDMKVGMIGELLIHLVLPMTGQRMDSVGIYFNLEEANIKKGFDGTYKRDGEIWLLESKSGSWNKGDITVMTASHIQAAKRDIVGKLKSKRTTLWQNALNGFSIANKPSDEKRVLEAILKGGYMKAEASGGDAKEHNIILAAPIFGGIPPAIISESIVALHATILKANIFKNLVVLAIQKTTVERVIKFLQAEAS